MSALVLQGEPYPVGDDWGKLAKGLRVNISYKHSAKAKIRVKLWVKE